MTNTMLYTDLSGYYDLLCGDIDYVVQSDMVRRLHHLLGNGGRTHLDLACGTGPHIRSFMDFGYQCSGLDIHQAMLDRARQRCPEAAFSIGDMCDYGFDTRFDLITCFLYSIHYSASIDQLKSCILSTHRALQNQGVFCFNAVDKRTIDNAALTRRSVNQDGSQFTFSSGWHYRGEGEQQSLRLRIDKTTQGITQTWQDEHAMVALTFAELKELLQPYFEVHVFAHDYDKLVPWDQSAGNALFVCVKQ